VNDKEKEKEKSKKGRTAREEISKRKEGLVSPAESFVPDW
jgi:hypothetical protein